MTIEMESRGEIGDNMKETEKQQRLSDSRFGVLLIESQQGTQQAPGPSYRDLQQTWLKGIQGQVSDPSRSQ